LQLGRVVRRSDRIYMVERMVRDAGGNPSNDVKPAGRPPREGSTR